MDDLLNEFLTETAESIDVVDTELVKLEQDPGNKEVIDNIFRLVHTIKGTCGFLGLPRLQAVAHASENVLGRFRDGAIPVTAESVSVVLESLDRIKAILADLERDQVEPEGDDEELISRLDAAAAGEAPAEAAVKAEPPVAKTPKTKPAPEPKAPAASSGIVSLEELERAFLEAPGPEDMDVPGPASVAADQKSKSLLERIGGPVILRAVVDTFHGKLFEDPDLRPFFQGVKPADLSKRMVSFLSAAFGGPDSYKGKSLSAAHAPILAKGLNGEHFDRFLEYFSETLDELDLDEGTTGEILMVLDAMREDVLKPAAKETAKAARKESRPAAASAPNKTAPSADPKDKAPETSVANQTIRVSVEVLEDLMTMVSEMVLTRNQLLQMVRRLDDSEFKAPLQRLNHCTTELQEAVMKTRMQPIGNAWAKLPRIVRDLAHDLGKKISLRMLGAETELDRQVLELIRDPLTHMVRNSADHGLETPQERAAGGKSEEGQITLNAYHEGGHIIIEIADDGRGLPIEKIKAKALANGLASEAELETLSDQQIQRFIFHAGFSTAEKVTNVSGRGVGMDVVRSNIERIGGTVDLKSEWGKGSTFIIKIPLTLAIVSALIVECGSERFAIPQLSVVELVRASADSEHKIERVNKTPVLRLRNRLLPLIYLKQALHLKDAAVRKEKADAGAAAQKSGVSSSASKGLGAQRQKQEDYIVVTQVGGFTFGVVVDRVFDTEEIVVKPVAPILRQLSIYSGNTILGDGSVIMILDPNGIAAMSGDVHREAGRAVEADAKAKASAAEKTSVLVFSVGDGAPKAVPLSLVARLEEIDVRLIEASDGGFMVQYRGALMPVISFRDGYRFKEEGRQSILVFGDESRTMGLAVDRIVDIVEQELDLEICSSTAGLLGTAVIAGKATEVIDVGHFMNKAFRDSMSARNAWGRSQAKTAARVLVVDDSSFFRSMLRPLLAQAGYDVVSVHNPDEALKLREDGQSFDLIVSDIEMPGMDGFAFAAQVRGDARWKATPMVALSSNASKQDVARGHQAGFDDYVTKFDREALVASLSRVMAEEKEVA